MLRLIIWGTLAVFPIVFGILTTIDGGMFMATISLLVGLVVTQVLLNNPETRTQGSSSN